MVTNYEHDLDNISIDNISTKLKDIRNNMIRF